MTAFFVSAWNWLKRSTREVYPFFVCALGGTCMSADLGWPGVFLASLSFAWALDLAATKAAAAARDETAAKLTAMLISGGDTTVTVDINHNA